MLHLTVPLRSLGLLCERNASLELWARKSHKQRSVGYSGRNLEDMHTEGMWRPLHEVPEGQGLLGTGLETVQIIF